MRLVILVALAGLLGCGLFQPRDAPLPCDPDTDPNCRPPAVFKEPIVPEFVRDNIKVAIEHPTIDPNYKDSLSDPGNGSLGFFYIPDAGAEAAALPGFFQGWNKDREVQFMLNLLEADPGAGTVPTCPDSLLISTTAEIFFTAFQDTGELTDDEARYEVRYEMAVTFTLACVDPTLCPDGDEDCDPVVTWEVIENYCGRAFWDLEGGDRNFWTLRQWEDLEPLPNPSGPCSGTMGLLRALSGQGN